MKHITDYDIRKQNLLVEQAKHRLKMLEAERDLVEAEIEFCKEELKTRVNNVEILISNKAKQDGEKYE